MRRRAMLAGQFFDRFGKEFEPAPAAATASRRRMHGAALPTRTDPDSGRWLWWLVAAAAVVADCLSRDAQLGGGNGPIGSRGTPAGH